MAIERHQTGNRGFPLKERIKYLLHTIRFLCRRDYAYNYPHAAPARWTETEFLKYQYWDKEADRIEKDITMMIGWIKEHKEKEDEAGARLYQDVVELFCARHLRIRQVQFHLSEMYRRKYGTPPEWHGILDKDGRVTHYRKGESKNNEKISA